MCRQEFITGNSWCRVALFPDNIKTMNMLLWDVCTVCIRPTSGTARVVPWDYIHSVGVYRYVHHQVTWCCFESWNPIYMYIYVYRRRNRWAGQAMAWPLFSVTCYYKAKSADYGFVTLTILVYAITLAISLKRVLSCKRCSAATIAVRPNCSNAQHSKLLIHFTSTTPSLLPMPLVRVVF